MDTDAERELAARRAEVEAEFDSKVRDLKAQVKRQADALARDREEWEARRRDQQRDLADRAEKVRRQEENHRRDVEALAVARRELEKVRSEAAEREAARIDAKAKEARLAAKVEGLKVSTGLTAGFAALALVGFAVCLLSAWLWKPSTTAILAGTFLVLAAVLEARRRLRAKR